MLWFHCYSKSSALELLSLVVIQREVITDGGKQIFSIFPCCLLNGLFFPVDLLKHFGCSLHEFLDTGGAFSWNLQVNNVPSSFRVVNINHDNLAKNPRNLGNNEEVFVDGGSNGVFLPFWYPKFWFSWNVFWRIADFNSEHLMWHLRCPPLLSVIGS